MKQQTQPNEWSCLPTSFAIVTGVKVDNIFKWLGHDGSERVFPDRPEPYCRKSFHPQELTDYCYWHGINIIQIDREVVSTNINGDVHIVCNSERRLYKYIESHNNFVLTGFFLTTGRWHAVACVNKTIYDPNGTECSLTDLVKTFSIESIFLIFR